MKRIVNVFPDFLDQYSAHVLAKMRAAGDSEAAILRRKPRQEAPASAVAA